MKEGEFVEVELEEEKENEGLPQMYLDVASTKSLWTSLLTLLTFMLLHILAACKAPKVLAYKDEYFKLNQTNGNSSVDIDITLGMLQEEHRFIDVNCTMLTNSQVSKETLKLADTNLRVIFSKNYTVINSLNTPKQTVQLVFAEGAKQSSGFGIIHRNIIGFDTVQVKITMTCDWSGVDGLVFTWAYANPAALKYNRGVRILMSALMFYMVAIFISFLHFDSEVYTQTFCIVLGVTGIFASNPISLLLKPSAALNFCDSIFMAAFVAVLRMFISAQLEMIRRREKSLGVIATIVMFTFFAFYGTSDATASHDRAELMRNSETESNIILPNEQNLIFLHILYFVVTIVQTVFALKNGGKSRRAILLIAFAVCEMIATMFSQIICPKFMVFSYNILPSVVYSTVHMVLGAFLIFYMHGDEGYHYKPVDIEDDNNGGCLDVEEATSDEPAGFDEEEAEFDVEEEEEEVE